MNVNLNNINKYRYIDMNINVNIFGIPGYAFCMTMAGQVG